MTREEKLKFPQGWWNSILKKFNQALPVIIFFLLLFYSTILLFNMKYIMLVTLMTVLFQTNFRKKHTFFSLLRICILHFILGILAFFATLNFPLCILLNLCVPFWLIFTKSSQFNQLGCFTGLMFFTFLQLIPTGWSDFTNQLLVMLYGLCFFIITTYLFIRKTPKCNDFLLEQKGLLLLGNMIEEQVKGNDISDKIEELFQIQQQLYLDVYQKQGNIYTVSTSSRKQYGFALMFQRMLHFFTNPNLVKVEEEQLAQLKLQVACYLKKAGSMSFNSTNRKLLITEGNSLFLLTSKQEEHFFQVMNNFLKMFFLILDSDQENHFKKSDFIFQRFLKQLRTQIRPDSFELRFALRMSIVLLIGMSYNILIKADHGYWFVMNAFLLLRPMYEDSKYRMKTRFIGTIIGCLLLSILLPICQTEVEHFFLATIMVIFMYMATVGTCLHSVFVTCFSLAMITLGMNNVIALRLRIFYVILACILVLLVNRFFFPTSFTSQFRYDYQMIFHMQHMYLRLLKESLEKPLEYWKLYDAQMQYHMIHQQLQTYLEKVPQEKLVYCKEYYQDILSTSWNMVSELELLLFEISKKEWEESIKLVIAHYIDYTDYVLNLILEMLQFRKEKEIHEIEGIQYQRIIEGEPFLSELMILYSKNVSKLYQLVYLRFTRK